MSNDSWSSNYNRCVSLGQEIRERINDRNKHPHGSSTYTKECAHVRSQMRQFSSQFAALRTELIQASTRLMPREVERRQLLLDELSTKERQMEEAFRNDRPSASRTALLEGFSDDLGPPLSSRGRNPFDTEADDTLDFNEMRQQQRQVMREQDSGLDALAAVISRQKAMAHDIGNELDTQNDLIDDITDHVDSTDQRLLRETRNIKIVDRKSNTCCMWAIIIFLFVAILVIAVVPFGGKP